MPFEITQHEMNGIYLVGTNPQLTFTFECPSSSRNRALALANFAGVSRPWFGFFDYRGWLRRRLHSRSEEHTSELQSQSNLVCRLLLEKKKIDISAPTCATIQH